MKAWQDKGGYTVAVDFDGVIHSYMTPWKGAHIIPDPPVLGVLDWLTVIAKRFHVAIHSTRCATPEGCEAVRAYLKSEHQTVYSPARKLVIPCFHPGLGGLVDSFDCTHEKVAALVYIDDRAYRFDGTNLPTAHEIHTTLRPWNKREMGLK